MSTTNSDAETHKCRDFRSLCRRTLIEPYRKADGKPIGERSRSRRAKLSLRSVGYREICDHLTLIPASVPIEVADEAIKGCGVNLALQFVIPPAPNA